MNDWQKFPILTRADGSYVITYCGNPYHVPNNKEFARLYTQVSAYAAEHPDQVSPEPGPKEPTVDEVRQGKLSEFNYVMGQNDSKLIRPMANNEENIVAYINDVQAQNRALRARVLEAETIEELQAITPVAVNLAEVQNA